MSNYKAAKDKATSAGQRHKWGLAAKRIRRRDKRRERTQAMAAAMQAKEASDVR